MLPPAGASGRPTGSRPRTLPSTLARGKPISRDRRSFSQAAPGGPGDEEPANCEKRSPAFSRRGFRFVAGRPSPDRPLSTPRTPHSRRGRSAAGARPRASFGRLAVNCACAAGVREEAGAPRPSDPRRPAPAPVQVCDSVSNPKNDLTHSGSSRRAKIEPAPCCSVQTTEQKQGVLLQEMWMAFVLSSWKGACKSLELPE